MASVPRGVQVVKWHNDDGSKSVRYRVRIQRKAFKADRLFDTLDEAKGFLADSRSPAGRDEAKRKAERWAFLKAAINTPDLAHYLDQWKKARLPKDDKVAALTEQKKKARSVAISRVNVVKGVVVKWSPEADHATGRAAGFVPGLTTKAFGQFKIADISSTAATNYIEARLEAGASPSTVKRDVSFLSSFFGDWLRSYDPKAVERHGNPFADASVKKKLKGADQIRDVRLADFGEGAEQRLFDELRDCRNPQMLAIVGIGLTTGMRRGEILSLTWDRVLKNQIILLEIHTKSGKARRIPISAGAEKIFQSLGRKTGPERLFSYTADGFKSVWNRVCKRAELPGFRFHDIRHEYVSKILEIISSPVAAAAVTGYSSVRNFERQHVQPFKDRKEIEGGIKTERGLMLAVGHSDNRMTANYASKIAGTVLSSATEAANAAKASAALMSYPVVIEAGEGVGVFAPDFGVFLACDTEEEALAKIAEAIVASPERPVPSSPMKVAKENQGAVVRIVKISSAPILAADESSGISDRQHTYS